MTEAGYYEEADLWRPERYDREDEERRLAAVAALVPDDSETLLDVGAGQGAFLRWLESHRPDLGLSAIERSDQAIALNVARTPITVASIEALPLEDRSFDAVTALEVLEHLPHRVYERGLAELARVAAHLIIVTVPHAERRRLVTCPYCGCRFHPHYHMRSFEPDAMSDLFAGFRLDQLDVLTYDDYLGGPLLRWGWRLMRGGRDEMLARNLCPQCGYREAATKRWRMIARNKIKARLPVRRRPNWILARFTRDG